MTIKLPLQLPEAPIGWTRELIMHMSFENGGSASYHVFDEHNVKMPFVAGYDTRPGGSKGYKLPGVNEILTWKKLREIWPDWLKDKGAK